MTVTQIAERIADELMRMLKAGEIKSINIDTVRLAIKATPHRFDMDELDEFEEAICRAVVERT